MKNYLDMVANGTAAIGDPVVLRGYATLDNESPYPVVDIKIPMVVQSIDSNTYDVTVVWIARSNSEVHKYTFKAMMLDYVGI